MNDLYRYVDAHADAFVHDLQRLCRQPSISAQGIGLQQCAELLAAQMQAKGIPARLEPVADGPPLVAAEIPGDSTRTLLIYDHYDVQPPDPLDEWESDPFAAEVRGGKLYARGAQDTKGNIMARVAAVDAWLRVRGRLPVTVKFLIEGEEEVGSPHLGAALNARPDLARADACLWESGAKDHRDVLNVYLGVKGMLYVNFEVTGARRDLHSASAAVVPSPVWKLLWALRTLKGPDEQVRIHGFYDDVAQPSPAELAQLERIAAQRDDAAALRELGIPAFVKGLTGVDLVRRLFFEPTCNICGLNAGYQGPGSKTVLPRRASAKVDFRLVPNQRSDDILAKLRDHFRREGFADIAFTARGAEPYKTPYDSPIVEVVAETAEEVYGTPPLILPTQAGTGPMHVVCGLFNIPAVGTGVGYAGGNNHGPNENIRIADYIQGIKHIALILERFAG
ncbi:MAG: M20/M25/M40 family metallo-hydrolase [Armatimonadota bacterium]|nr:M20/M25/M40 family metallo-hydrolase [Armatimonadota bacterium]